MAKSVNIAYDKDGNPIVSMTELPPAPVVPPSSPKKRIPSSPHKPFQSSNFYDLTKSTAATPRMSAADTSIVDLTKSNSSSPEVVVRETHRPFTSSGMHVSKSAFAQPQTFYNNPPTTETDRRKTVPSPIKLQNSQTSSSGFRALQQMDRQKQINTIPTIPGPYASKETQKAPTYPSGFTGKKGYPSTLNGIHCSFLIY
jgi:hypothetical protein